MDDKYVENLLREGWEPKTPDGMRNRVLRRVRAEATTSPRVRRAGWLPRWQLAVVGLALAIILITNVSESARDTRLLEMVCGDTACDAGVAASIADMSILNQKQEIDRLLAQAMTGSDGYYE